MIWAATLLSVSGYCWYLVFAYICSANGSANYPGFGAGLAGFLLLAVLPTFIGFFSNRSLLTTGPTVLKLAIINLLQYLLYAALTVLAGTLVKAHLLKTSPELLYWKAYLFPSSWQLLSWLCGLYFVFKATGPEAVDRPANIQALEISLVLVIPAVFLLTYNGFPASLLMLLITCWFMTLALTLAVEGTGFSAASVIRYDLIIFHAVIPSLAAVIIFLAAFWGQVRSLLQTAQKALVALWALLIYLLKLIPAGSPAAPLPDPGITSLSMKAGEMEQVPRMPLWFYAPFIALGLLLLFIGLWGLINLLKTRLSAAPRTPQRKYSLFRGLAQFWRWLAVLAWKLLTSCWGLFKWICVPVGKLRQKIMVVLRGLLPAKTPDQKIFRVYEIFLRLGRRFGCPRKTCETPLEYVRRLQTSGKIELFPGEEVEELTSLFLKARYSHEPVSWQQAAISEQLLKIIRSKLK